MEGESKVLRLLNDILRKELTGINQYFVHAKMCENWGYDVLAGRARKESIEEMKHADQVIDRILHLEGTPNMSDMDKITIGRNVREQLESDMAVEKAALGVLKPGIVLCTEVSDHGTRELLEHMLVSEEQHISWIESQLHQIEEMGYENYLTLQVRSGKGD